MLDEQAAYLVGQALGQLQAGQQAGQQPRYERGVRRQMTPQQAQERAGRFLGRAFQLYLQGGLTKEQATQRIVQLAQMFGSLE